MKKLWLAIIFSTFYFASHAQSGKLYFGLSQNFGLDRQNITVGSATSQMSMTSTVGLNFGVGIDIYNAFEVVAGAGYLLHFGYTANRTNGNTTTASESFNIKRLNLGIANTFEISEKVGVRAEFGYDFSFPGTLNVKVGSEEHGEVTYGNVTSFYARVGFPVKISDKLRLIPTLGYHGGQFEAETYGNGDIFDLDPSVFFLDASSIELGLNLAMYL
ncbi:MAG: hypothetical protein AAFN93_04305 [Bacteroidota bacterium]